ncbi:hypothetical protein TWF730_004156 [Orbilia blumenaviensis]|uniref:Methyltransferase domain-containing protein n=1 Tax=Orbilia blumenaviensis TaxID=1796055 RepID=A0AAV9TZC9_9PEZI
MSTHHHLPTSTAYDLWSTVYDTDGNVLQQLDDIYISTILPSLIPQSTSTNTTENKDEDKDDNTTATTVVELGCGTGRNTLKLSNMGVNVLAVDNSRGMLDKLTTKLKKYDGDTTTTTTTTAGDVQVFEVDITTFSTEAVEAVESEEEERGDAAAFRTAINNKRIDGIISTLVLEHIPLRTFFSTASHILPQSSNAWLLLTNMHESMGAISSAGFWDEKSQRKVKPVSYVHTKAEILDEAGKWGFVVVDDEEGFMRESGVGGDVEDAKGRFGGRAEKWVGVVMHFGVVFRRV